MKKASLVVICLMTVLAFYGFTAITVCYADNSRPYSPEPVQPLDNSRPYSPEPVQPLDNSRPY